MTPPYKAGDVITIYEQGDQTRYLVLRVEDIDGAICLWVTLAPPENNVNKVE